MNKQEFQQNIKDMKPANYINSINSINSITIYEAYNEGFEEAKQNVLFGSDFLDEPNKQAVPQFIADWYENNKYNIENSIYRLCVGFYSKTLDKEIYDWFRDPKINSIETLVKMKFFGYEVEKEKLYTVEIPNPNAEERPILFKKRDGKVQIIFPSVPCWRAVKNAQLTEAEIKQDFAWSWQFAKEVEE